MTPAQFFAARTALGLTQAQMAARLRMGAYGWQKISAWENGRKPIPGIYSLAVELLEAAAIYPKEGCGHA